MPKSLLHLSIDTGILELAKNSGINLSGEFEEWIKVRLRMDDESMPKESIDNEIIKYQQEIQKLRSMSEIVQSKEMVEREKLMVIDNTIDNRMKYKKEGERISKIPKERAKGLMFMLKKKYNDRMTEDDAAELLLKRMKERGLL